MSDYIIVGGELCHYGVKGMKWGVRRYEQQQNSIKRLTDKRNKIATEKGVSSTSYINTSRNLYVQKQKAKYTKAKIDNDADSRIIAKKDIKQAKQFKKHGVFTYGGDGNDLRKVYGYNLTNKQKEAIRSKEVDIDQRKTKINRVKKTTATVLSTAAPILISTGVSYYNNNRTKIAGQLAKKNVDIKKVNHVLNKVNQVVLKAKYG